MKKVGKTTIPLMYDLTQIPYNYTVEVTNRFKGLDMVDVYVLAALILIVMIPLLIPTVLAMRKQNVDDSDPSGGKLKN